MTKYTYKILYDMYQHVYLYVNEDALRYPSTARGRRVDTDGDGRGADRDVRLLLLRPTALVRR